eukprot:CAMPEP_0196237304 /NCGR_PEP_ID=MMETSP0913-20130531/6389_1 /TAXON_ID=49265 /ORGANISM="Thalassiosira rotula, Strain GSO102" /LENGTH=56 /DNA_ID=CAMNT_0041518841 /DNA_START=76 /DNA_END=246 /DNA_ORIENTATION=-
MVPIMPFKQLRRNLQIQPPKHQTNTNPLPHHQHMSKLVHAEQDGEKFPRRGDSGAR